ncbi:MAG TPA: nucleotidyltransferase domain-containing protein [Candidatus Bilamarchaeaceae archaeon]|nr:nucleotidyltransferase domain-containing protein [Candidatus Bilamarchaeaceae archaeon]
MEREKIIKILKGEVSKNHIKRAYIFGSFARKRPRYNDIDLAIEPSKGFSLLDLSRMANVIEEKTGIHVDLVTLRSMHPELKKIIEKEMVAI